MNELKRTKIDVSGRTVTVPAGAALYHGTGESFDARFPRGGGYDGVFWTTTSPKVARSYIPDAPSTISFDISHLLRRENDDYDKSILRQLGFTEKVKHAAYAIAERMNEKGRDAYRRIREAKNRIKELTPGGKLDDAWKVQDPEIVAQLDAAFEEWSRAEDDEKNSKYVDAQAIMGAFIKMKLRTLGYEPYDSGLYGSYRDVKMSGDRIMPADWRLPGRILVARPRRDLNLINMAQGRESDLTELDYHRHDWFEKADAEGYDGIVITDFAQHKGYGNVGHISYGLFKRGVAACEIKAVRDQLHPTIAEWDASESLARRNEVKEAKINAGELIKAAVEGTNCRIVPGDIDQDGNGSVWIRHVSSLSHDGTPTPDELVRVRENVEKFIAARGGEVRYTPGNRQFEIYGDDAEFALESLFDAYMDAVE